MLLYNHLIKVHIMHSYDDIHYIASILEKKLNFHIEHIQTYVVTDWLFEFITIIELAT